MIQIYDMESLVQSTIDSSKYPGSLTYADFEKERTHANYRSFFNNFYNSKIRNSAIHELGPIVIRTMIHPDHYRLYDIYDKDGRLLTRNLRSGASVIDILDTNGSSLIGKVFAMDFVSKNDFKKILYQPELSALSNYTDVDDSHFLWKAHLAE